MRWLHFPNKDVTDLLTMSASKEREYERERERERERENENDPLQGMSVQEYLNWRSGGSGVARSGGLVYQSGMQ